jgi:hypothetical protein
MSNKCKCRESAHGHDGTVCDIPIKDTEKVCFRCGATTEKITLEENINDMGLRD